MRNSSTAFLFSGQGAQYVGMMQDIADAYPESAACFALADDILGYGVSHDVFFGPADVLNLTEHTQPAMLTAEAAVLRVFQARNIFPAMVAGFSLGEWTALHAAGVLDFEDTLRLVRLRAGFMQQAVPVGKGAMAAILGKSAADVEALCAQYGVFPSNYNCPGQITVAGYSANMDKLMETAEKEGIAAKRLAVSIPSHCPLMQPAAEKLAEAVGKYTFCTPEMPVVMNALGKPVTNTADLQKNIVDQLIMPVRFEQSIAYMLDAGIDRFIEIGPGKVLTSLVKKTAKALGREVTALRTDSVESLQACLALWEA